MTVNPSPMHNPTNPPPNGDTSIAPPPRYTAVVTRVYPYSLRPVLLFTTFIGFIWAMAMGIGAIRDRGDDGETSKEKLFDIIGAILFFVVAAIEVFGFFVALMQNLKLAKLLNFLVPVAVLTAFGSNVVNVIGHFTLKTDLLNQCINDNTGDLAFDTHGDLDSVSKDEATAACNEAWKHDTWAVFAWLFVTLILSVMFASIALAYYRQLLDPSSVRSRMTASQTQSFPMGPPPQSYYAGPTHNDNTQQQQWMVPPYPGPPANAPPQGYEKSDYQPGAEWAQYAPPDGPPPPGVGVGVGVNRAEDEAWERARAEGSTAHFTNGSRRVEREEEDVGFVVPNREEDEAWERAREEGVTAHYTGHGRKPATAI